MTKFMKRIRKGKERTKHSFYLGLDNPTIIKREPVITDFQGLTTESDLDFLGPTIRMA